MREDGHAKETHKVCVLHPPTPPPPIPSTALPLFRRLEAVCRVKFGCAPATEACQSTCEDRLVGLVVKASASGAEVPGFQSCLRRDFSGSSHTGDLKIGTLVATLSGAWRYRVSAGTGRPGVSILLLGEVESWICNFYLSVAARKNARGDPSPRYTNMLMGR